MSGSGARTVGLLVGAALAACAEAPARPECGSLDGQPLFAVVLSEYQSSAIALLDGAGEALTECWIDSGTRAPGLVAALSGDVVLATDQPPGALAVIDRFGTDVYSEVSLAEPAILGQVRLQDPAISGAFSANPHDAVQGDGGLVWVSRFGANIAPSTQPLARGSDLLEIDPRAFVRTGRRISLEPFEEAVRVDTDRGPVMRTAYPRPSRLVRVGPSIVIGLARFTLRFDGIAPGAVAVADVSGGAPALHPLPEGVCNCGRVVPVPGRGDLVAVGCIGFSRPFGVAAEVRARSGLFVLRVAGSEVSVVRAWRPADHPDAPLAVAEVVAIDERTVVALAYGPPVDSYYAIDLETGHTDLLFAADRAFDVGVAAYDPRSGLLVVPDAGRGLRRFRRDPDGGFEAMPTLPLDAGVGLPPRFAQVLE